MTRGRRSEKIERVSLSYKIQLALRHQERGQMDRAEALYLEVLQSEPGNWLALNFLGTIRQNQNRLLEAVELLTKAVQINDQSAQLHSRLAGAHLGLRDHTRALEHANRALAIEDDLDARVFRIICLREKKKMDESLAETWACIEKYPNAPVPYMHLGNALRDLDQWDDALKAFDRGITLDPKIPEPYSNRGNVYKDLGRFDEAIRDYEKAIELKPDFQDAHVNLAIVLLMRGNFERGWKEYEWRLHTRKKEAPLFAHHFWRGNPIPGKILWLHSEQGFGDAINFIRFAKVLRSFCAGLFVTVQPKLKRLLSRVDGPDILLSTDDPPPRFHFHAPFMSLPSLFGCGFHNTPAAVPYLQTETALVEKWKLKMAAVGRQSKIKIGLCWQGNKDFPDDRNRSIALQKFGPLLSNPEVQFFSLQKGFGSEQIKNGGFENAVIDWTEEMDSGNDAFVDMAAVVENLDLVISVDTSVAHLAGALAKPTWLLLPLVPDWRWLDQGDTNHWYPSFKLFRQVTKQNWDPVFEQVQRELQEWTSKTSLRSAQ
jgi:tetratricopeptide (TPR) repeat protein